MKFIKSFVYDWKLRYKLLVSYLLLTLVPMLVIFFYFQLRFVYRLENTTLEMEQVIVEQTAGSVEAYMDQIVRSAESAAYSDEILEALTCTESQLDELLNQERRRDALLTCLENLRSQADGEVVRGIRIYVDSGHPLLARRSLSGYRIFESIEKIDTSLWYGRLHKKARNELAASAFWLNSWENNNMGNISYIKKIQYFSKGEKKEAYAAVYFKQGYLSKILESYGDYPHSCIYLIDDREGMVAIEGQGEFEQFFLDYQDIDRMVGTEKSFRKVDYGGREAWTLYCGIGRTTWKMVFAVSTDAITQETKADGRVFMGIYCVIAMGLCLLMILLAQTITGRVTCLKNQMQQVNDEPPRVLEISSQRDEIGELMGSYNRMAGQIDGLMAERVRLEMNMLRSQINPHFLYNTLDMISWYAIKGRTGDVTESIQALAQFYRLSLNHGELLTVLEQEIELIQRYVELQCRRVSCTIELVVDIPEEMLEKQIPQFLLQPIVENSLKHGILEKEEQEGYITVTGWMEEGEMVLLLGDDGVGMDESQVNALLNEQPKKGCEEGMGHIGIHNIYRRLQLFYGKDGFSMHYSSRPGEGTQVELRLRDGFLKEVGRDEG